MGRKGIVSLVLWWALIPVLAGCGSNGGSEESQSVSNDDALAVIDGVPLKPSAIDARLSRMDAETRAQFDDPSALSMMIDREVRMRVLAAAAEDEGYKDMEDYRLALESASMLILAEIYSQRVKEEASRVSEEDLREAYERDKHLYSTNATTRARHIVCPTEQEAVAALEAIRGGMPFEQAVDRYSIDNLTKGRSGDLGSLTRESIIPGLGASPEFMDAIAGIEGGEVGGPIQTRAGFHIVQVLSRVEGDVPSLNQIRGTLMRRLEKERSETGLTEVMERLWDKYDVTINTTAIKNYIGFPTTPEGLVRTLGEVTSSGDKITLCREMVKEFPDNKYAPYMLFMEGFVFSEELHNHMEAERAFRELLQRYPNSDYAGAARWMIENMGGDHPQLRNAEDVVNRAKSAGF
jgi:peptidyl-prolyl cis-trans isomerase C